MTRGKRGVRKADRERLRQNMRKHGHTHVDQVSAAMRHHWQYGYPESEGGSRLAIEARDQIEDFLTVTPTQPLTP